MRLLRLKRHAGSHKITRLCPLGMAGILLLSIQGCVTSGFYYLPSADVPAGVNKKVRKAPCALPVGGPYAIFLTYPGLTISAAASGYMDVTTVPGPADANTDLSLRLAVNDNHSVVTALSDVRLDGMSGTRYYSADVPAGKVTGTGNIRGGSGGTYRMIIMNTESVPLEFQVVIPSLLLDGREIGPVTIVFTRHVGIWVEPLSC